MFPGSFPRHQGSGTSHCQVRYPPLERLLPVSVTTWTTGKHINIPAACPVVTFNLERSLLEGLLLETQGSTEPCLIPTSQPSSSTQMIPAGIQFAHPVGHIIRMTSTVLTAASAKIHPLVVSMYSTQGLAGFIPCLCVHTMQIPTMNPWIRSTVDRIQWVSQDHTSYLPLRVKHTFRRIQEHMLFPLNPQRCFIHGLASTQQTYKFLWEHIIRKDGGGHVCPRSFQMTGTGRVLLHIPVSMHPHRPLLSECHRKTRGILMTVPRPSRLGADVRNHSKSWDNIIIPHMDRDHGVSRGRSYENLLNHRRQGVPSNNNQQPVIVNLSSSPRRYAALSLSENCLEKCAGDRQNSAKGQWFVTPEITITDNDIRAANSNKRDGGTSSWNKLNTGRCQTANLHNLQRPANPPESTERKNTNYSLQQSLEQLDELLADLVIDYKPQNSRRSSKDLIDQLKQLIHDDETKEGKRDVDQEDSGLLNTQTDSSKTSPDTFKDPDSGCEGFQRSVEDVSLNHIPDEDDTMVCSNRKCLRKDTTFNASLYFKSCHSCYTYYCSRNCRREDWDTHKETCLYGRISSVCRHILKHCRENSDIHKAFSRTARVGYLSRGRGVLFLGFPNPGCADNFVQVGLDSLTISPTYLSLRELDSFKDNLGQYGKELQNAGKEYDPTECFLLNVSIAVGELVPKIPSPKLQMPTVRKYAKVSLASSSPDKKIFKKECEMETLILTPPPGTSDIDKEGQEGRKAREICFINIQRELRTRGVFLRHEFPQIYNQLCEFVDSNKRFTPTTIYPIDKRTGKQFMCMIMAASEPRMLDWVGAPHLLDDII